MRRIIFSFFWILVLAGCQGGSGTQPIFSQQNVTSPTYDGPPRLVFEVDEEPGVALVSLVASDVTDLYQIAATIRFPAEKYVIEQIEAGGGLGGPEESFFVGDVTETGRLDFAYTRRFMGPGRNGYIRLIRFRASFQESFSLSDFSIQGTPDDLVARDGGKREIALELPGGAQ